MLQGHEARPGRWDRLEAQLHSHKPTKRNAKNSKQNIQIQNATQPSHFEAFKTTTISYHNTSLHRSLLGLVTFGILLHLQENSWCKSLSMSFAMSRSCHVVMSRDYVKSVNSLEEKTPTMHPWDPLRTGEPGTWWTTGRSCCIPNGGMAGGGGSGLHELCMTHLVAKCKTWFISKCCRIFVQYLETSWNHSFFVDTA